MRDTSQNFGGSVGSIPSSFASTSRSSSTSSAHNVLLGTSEHQSTPATNLKLSEAVRNAHHDGSPSVVSRNKMKSSKSYTSGLNETAGTVSAPSTSSSTTNLAHIDISANNTQFFEVMYVGKIKVSHKRVPFTFIDDALPKFKAYDAQKIKMQADAARKVKTYTYYLKWFSLINFYFYQLSESVENSQSQTSINESQSEDEAAAIGPASGDDKSNDKQNSSDDSNELKIVEDADADKHAPDELNDFKEKIINTRLSEENKENNIVPLNRKMLMRGQSQVALPVKFE